MSFVFSVFVLVLTRVCLCYCVVLLCARSVCVRAHGRVVRVGMMIAIDGQGSRSNGECTVFLGCGIGGSSICMSFVFTTDGFSHLFLSCGCGGGS